MMDGPSPRIKNETLKPSLTTSTDINSSNICCFECRRRWRAAAATANGPWDDVNGWYPSLSISPLPPSHSSCLRSVAGMSLPCPEKKEWYNNQLQWTLCRTGLKACPGVSVSQIWDTDMGTGALAAACWCLLVCYDKLFSCECKVSFQG